MKKFLKTCAAVALLGCSLSLAACAEGGESFDLAASASLEHGKIILTQTTAKAGERVRLACLPDAGYALKGYKVDGEPIDGCAFTMPAKAVEVSAEFTLLEYGITYVLDGGTVAAGNPDKYTVEDGDIALNQPSKEGYEFGGWYYYFRDTEMYFANPDDYKADKIAAGTIGEITLYARYYNTPYEVNVDYSQNNLVYVEPDTYWATMGDTVNLSYEMYSEYYEFVCFTVDGVDIEGDSFVMPNRTVEVGARLKAIEWTISYELDGGDNPPENPTVYTIENETLEIADAAKDGHYFVGWYFDENFEEPVGMVMNDDGEWVNGIYGSYAKNLTLYALFEPETEE